MAQAWSGDISVRTIGKSLNKIGFTRKKNLWRERERDEEKRQHFLEYVLSQKPEILVYVDESGIDNL